MNNFYEKNIVIQWVVAIIFLACTLAMMGTWIDLTTQHILWYLAIIPFVPFFQFLFTPFSKLTGMYTYLSPMLLVFGASEKRYDLHNGTSFDYFFVMRKIRPGIAARKKILEYFLEGLLEIIDRIEKGKLPDTLKISGSSYFFSERTAKRLGFSITDAGIFAKINLLFNIVDLTWMYSYAKGKFTFPNFSKIRKAEIDGQTLVSKKEELIRLLNYLRRN